MAPDLWCCRRGASFGEGTFRLQELPKVEANVQLFEGWFNETLPAFIRGLAAGGRAGPQGPGTGRPSAASAPWARMVHIDCDLYSSTREVLWALAPLFRPGTILVFDELVNYPEFMSGELRALFEFLREHPWRLRVLYAPWDLALAQQDFDTLAADGVKEPDLLQSVAFELLD